MNSKEEQNIYMIEVSTIGQAARSSCDQSDTMRSSKGFLIKLLL